MQWTILVVDDSRLMRMTMRRLLEARGYKVVEAVHGQAGREALDFYDPDLVITDLHMPILDGIGLVRALREHPRHSGVPVIMASAEAVDQDKRTAREAGVNFWLDKPVDAARLGELVDWALDLRRIPAQADPSRRAAVGI